MTKICKKCNKLKTLEYFHKNKKLSDGRTNACKECINSRIRAWNKANPEKYAANKKKSAQKHPRPSKNSVLKFKFGITADQFNSLLKTQGGVCAICKKFEVIKTKEGRAKSLAVDHCHSTGKVRGLLCQFCNQGLGFFKDNIFLLEDAINYLIK